MTREQALNILRPTGNSLDALLQAYREKAKRWHPDMNPGNESEAAEVFKTVSQAYEMLRENVGDWFGFTDPEYSTEPSLDEELFDILNKIRHLPDIAMEVCGTWLWVTGNTKPVHTTLKEHGLKFAPKKKAWYWRPEGYRKRGGKPWEMSAIRARYGSQDIDTEPAAQVMG